MAAGMAEEYRETLLLLEEKKKKYDVVALEGSLRSLEDPLKAINEIVKARQKRGEAEGERRRKAQELQKQLAAKQDAAAKEAAAEAADGEADAEAMIPAAAEEEEEPALWEHLGVAPRQPLPTLDLSPLGLPFDLSPDLSGDEGDGDEASERQAEEMALFQQLAASQQLFVYAGALDGESASPLLRLLFQVVSYGDHPYAALQQAVQYYSEADGGDMGWVPQLPDFLSALSALGCQPPPRGGAPGSSARRQQRGSAGQDGGAGAGASPPTGAAGGSGRGSAAVGGGAAAARLANLQCLLRLLVSLLRLQAAGRLELDCGSQQQAAGKALFSSLLRLLLDPHLTAALYPDIRAALEALADPWDGALWRRIADDAAQQAAEAGPSHRAALRVIAAVQGCGERIRGWQQTAALVLLRRMLPQSFLNSSGAAAASAAAAGGSSRRGQPGPDPREVRCLLGEVASVGAARALIEALKRPQQQPQQQPQAGGVDYWRLLTALQAAHLAVWHSAYECEEADSEELAGWMAGFLRCMEQALRGRESLVMRVKVFLAEALSHYGAGCMTAE